MSPCEDVEPTSSGAEAPAGIEEDVMGQDDLVVEALARLLARGGHMVVTDQDEIEEGREAAAAVLKHLRAIGWRPGPEPAALLKEDGGRLLQENGSPILLDGPTPSLAGMIGQVEAALGGEEYLSRRRRDDLVVLLEQVRWAVEHASRP